MTDGLWNNLNTWFRSSLLNRLFHSSSNVKRIILCEILNDWLPVEELMIIQFSAKQFHYWEHNAHWRMFRLIVSINFPCNASVMARKYSIQIQENQKLFCRTPQSMSNFDVFVSTADRFFFLFHICSVYVFVSDAKMRAQSLLSPHFIDSDRSNGSSHISNKKKRKKRWSRPPDNK